MIDGDARDRRERAAAQAQLRIIDKMAAVLAALVWFDA